MRKGELLVEHSPQYLLNHFQTENLEKVFLNICLKLTKDMPQNYMDYKSDNNECVNPNKKHILNDKEVKENSFVSSVKRLIIQTQKNVILLMRNKR